MQDIQNDTGAEASQALRQCADELGEVLAGLGLAITPSRMFAFLALRSQPVSLDEIAEALGVSKSGVSVAGRVLETVGFARRVRQPGTKRVWYAAMSNMEALMASRMQGFYRFREKLREALPLAQGEPARRRVEEMIDFYDFMGAKTEEMLAEWKERRQP